MEPTLSNVGILLIIHPKNGILRLERKKPISFSGEGQTRAVKIGGRCSAAKRSISRVDKPLQNGYYPI
jgi:hypothetical protein